MLVNICDAILLDHSELTHWGRVTHICVSKLTIIASDNGLSLGRRQAIIWTSGGILLIGLLGTNFSEILIEIMTFSFMKMCLKVSSAKWRPCCLGLNVLSVDIPLDIVIVILSEKPGYCFDINMKSFQYRYFRYKDSIVSRPCYLYNGIPLKYCLYI